jgi:hypothetical protein
MRLAATALAGLLALSVGSYGLPSHAQSRNCGERERIVDLLGSTYGEFRQSIGLAANNQVMEVFANVESGSWTITVTLPSGIACLIASGMAYEDIREAPAPMGEPG